MVHIAGQHRYGGGSHVSNKPLTKHDYLVMSLIIIFTPIVVLWICIKIIQPLFYPQSSKSKTKLFKKSSIKKTRNKKLG